MYLRFTYCLSLSILMSGCASTKNVAQPDISPRNTFINATEIKRQSISENPPIPPISGKAFYGLITEECPHPVLGSGTFVVGFWEYKGVSPSRSAGVTIGDRIITVNDRDKVTAEKLGTYIKRVARNAAHTIDILRVDKKSGIIPKTIEFRSLALPDWCFKEGFSPPIGESRPCLVKTKITSCSSLY